VFEHEVELFDGPDRVARTQTVADRVPISQIMTPHVVCAAPDLPLDDLIALMVRERLGCVPTVAADVMMPLAISLDQDASVKNAAALLAIEDLHHVMVVSERRLIGIVSTMDITRWLAGNDGALG
jgi:CBS domain-containing protein